MFHLLVIEHGAKQSHGVFLILGLVTRLGILNEDFLLLAGIGVLVLITQAHTGLHLVHVLASGTATAECIP